MIIRLLYLLLGLLGLVRKKSAYVSFLIFVFVVIAFGWNYDNPDYENYLLKYEWKDGEIFLTAEIGFNFLCYIGNSLHLSFQEFRLFIGIISYLLLYLSIKKISYNLGLVASIYLLFFLFIDVTQIRNLLSFTIVLFAFVKYIRDDSKIRDIILYTILVIIASSIHFSSIFFLVFIFALKDIKIIHVLVFAGLAGFFNTVIYLFLENYFDKILNYTEDTASTIAAIGFSFIQVLNYWIISAFMKKTRRSKLNMISVISPRMQEIILKCNMLLISLIPFYFTGAIFTRLFRFTALINIIYLSNLIPRKRKFKYILALIIYALYFHIMFNGFGLFTELANSVFNYNLLFSI